MKMKSHSFIEDHDGFGYSNEQRLDSDQPAQVSRQSTTGCVHTSAQSRDFHISQVRALVACSMNRDQGRDLEKSKAKCGNHVVPLCDKHVYSHGGRTARVIQVGGSVAATAPT